MPSGEQVYERGLHRAVLAGDERAWVAWYQAAFGPLHAYVLWRCAGLRDVADEIVGETWLIAVRRIGTFDPERGSFLSWLRGIATHLLRNHFRKVPPPLPLDSDPQAPPTESERREQAERVALVLAALPERYEAVLRAKYLDRDSVAEIALAWNETPKAIESLLTRAREAFRQAHGLRQDDAAHLRENQP